MNAENETSAPPDKPSIGREVDTYLRHIDGLSSSLPVTGFLLQFISRAANRLLHKFENEHCKVTEDDRSRSVEVPAEQMHRWSILDDRYQRLQTARDLVPRSLFVALVSQYDAFLGRLLRTIFILRPEMLNASEKPLTFAQLSAFKSMEEARDFVIEKEVESILRSSHAEQFRWMENRFGLTLTKGLDIWPKFVELTERRNLFVHADGKVSRQYLAVCKEHGYQTNSAEGEQLSVPKEYFDTAFVVLFEIGVKLAHVLWRKLFPEDRKAADGNLMGVTFRLMQSKRYDVGCTLLDFARTELKRHASEWHELVFTVNSAQCYRWAGKKERCAEIMASLDWSAKSDEFRLARAVLAEDWEDAAATVARIGREGKVAKSDYRDWPLFQEFRGRKEFLDAYENVFGERFTAETTTTLDDADFQALADEAGMNINVADGTAVRKKLH